MSKPQLTRLAGKLAEAFDLRVEVREHADGVVTFYDPDTEETHLRVEPRRYDWQITHPHRYENSRRFETVREAVAYVITVGIL